MAFRVPLVNFSKGEVSPELYGRFDVASYNAALKRGRNVVVLKTGAVTMRPGLRFVGEVYDSTKPARLVPFQFNLDQSYALELGQGTMRPSALGGYLLENELMLTGATQANPVVLEAAYHGYVVGDDVYLSGIVGMTDLNDRTFRVVSVIDANHFGINVDGSYFSAFVSATGGSQRTAPIVPPPPAPAVVPPVQVPPPPVVRPPGGGPGISGGIDDDIRRTIGQLFI